MTFAELKERDELGYSYSDGHSKGISRLASDLRIRLEVLTPEEYLFITSNVNYLSAWISTCSDELIEFSETFGMGIEM